MEILTFDNLLLSELKNSAMESAWAASENVSEYVRVAFSESTRRAYRCDLAHFRAWGGVLPSSPEMIARYLAHYGASLKAATHSRRVIALGKAHTAQGMANPCDTDLVRATLKGIRRTHGVAQRQARPLLSQDLLLILDQLSDGPKAIRDKALLLIGFAGALRRAELVALNVEDVEDATQGVVLHVRRSKTDQQGQGRKIGIPYARGRHCPVLALREWLRTAEINEGKIFRPVDRHSRISDSSLSPHAVSKVVKECISLLGHDSQNYSGHSLRAGLATSAASAGLPSWKIRQQTGHASEAMLQRYIRDGELFKGNVLLGLL